ncbi:MAG: DUF1015 domain-containing protein [Acidobacteria bacterium]|nr:DUF1015 domain-containing protein [Acidobacteriota bacterium]
MALIRPFRALRPAPEVAPRVASVPYDVVSTEEARALAHGNPLSFLHVTRSEIDLPPDTDPYSPEVYEQAVRNLEELKRSAPLLIEAEPALYLYRLRMGTHEQTGLAAAYSVDEYDRDLIKKHERTRRDKEDDRTRHITQTRAQTGVVFLTYLASAPVNGIAARVTATPPLYDFTAGDGIRHTVWKVTGAEMNGLVQAFAQIPVLYIADGHHRAASAARVRSAIKGADTFLAVAFPDDQMQILPYNRVVKDLAGNTPDGFLKKLNAVVPVKDGRPSPPRPGLVEMYLAGTWHELDLWNVRPAATTDRAETLDVSVLQHKVIEPLLNIRDVRTDKRIDFVGGARGAGALQRLVDEGKAAVAFSMHPVTVEDLIAIADEGGIMPPKSTWFEPKLRDGLIVNLI